MCPHLGLIENFMSQRVDVLGGLINYILARRFERKFARHHERDRQAVHLQAGLESSEL